MYIEYIYIEYIYIIRVYKPTNITQRAPSSYVFLRPGTKRLCGCAPQGGRSTFPKGEDVDVADRKKRNKTSGQL